MRLILSRGSSILTSTTETVEVPDGTIEAELPFGVNILSGGGPYGHQHYLTSDAGRSYTQIAVFVSKDDCRWCKAGYR